MTVGKRHRALAAIALVLTAGSASAQVSSADTTSRLIVKFRDSATLQSQAAANARFARVTDDAASAGVALTYHRAMAIGAHVMALERPLTIAAANAIAARLAQNPDVEFAVPDIRRHAYRTTNDPYLSSTSRTSAA